MFVFALERRRRRIIIFYRRCCRWISASALDLNAENNNNNKSDCTTLVASEHATSYYHSFQRHGTLRTRESFTSLPRPPSTQTRGSARNPVRRPRIYIIYIRRRRRSLDLISESDRQVVWRRKRNQANLCGRARAE